MSSYSPIMKVETVYFFNDGVMRGEHVLWGISCFPVIFSTLYGIFQRLSLKRLRKQDALEKTSIIQQLLQTIGRFFSFVYWSHNLLIHSLRTKRLVLYAILFIDQSVSHWIIQLIQIFYLQTCKIIIPSLNATGYIFQHTYRAWPLFYVSFSFF